MSDALHIGDPSFGFDVFVDDTSVELCGETPANDYNVGWSALLSLHDAIRLRDILTEFIDAQDDDGD